MLARTLAKEFFTDPQRGYGENVIVVFNKLRASKFTDPYQPASEPANLTGSSDNGAAVRVMPLALAYWQQPERMLTEAYNATRLTHTHSEGLLGALLQCAALRLCLLQEPGQGARPPAGFLAELELQLAAAERETQRDGDGLGLAPSESALYRKQLRAVAALCERSRVEPTDDEVLDRLGHSTRALYSVPTAIYCFLRAGEHPGDGGPMRRALEYAVSLGGDTDTIAAMTGALAGAYHGRDCLSDSLIRHCEGAPLFEQLADALLKFSNTAT